MYRLTTHSRSSPDLRMALACAKAFNCEMRSRTARPVWVVGRSHALAVESLIGEPAAAMASSIDMPMARPRQ